VWQTYTIIVHTKNTKNSIERYQGISNLNSNHSSWHLWAIKAGQLLFNQLWPGQKQSDFRFILALRGAVLIAAFAANAISANKCPKVCCTYYPEKPNKLAGWLAGWL